MSLIALMLSRDSEGVIFKVGLNGCNESQDLISLSAVGLDGCGASAVLSAYTDMIDSDGFMNILDVWHLK